MSRSFLDDFLHLGIISARSGDLEYNMLSIKVSALSSLFAILED